MREATCGLLLAALALATGCRPAEGGPLDRQKSAAAPAAHASADEVSLDVLAALGALAGVERDDEMLQGWLGRIRRKDASIDDFIEEILSRQNFSKTVIPDLVFGAFLNVRNYYALPSAFILRRTELDRSGRAVYYLREPCDPAEAKQVTPWWDPQAEVLVCPDSYRPERWTVAADEHSYRSRMPLSCDGQVGSPELEVKPLCGCGPNLIRCLRDDGQYEELSASLMAEVRDTAAWVVEHDLDVAQLFTANETFRDRNAEYYYRRQRIETEHQKDPLKVLADLSRWPVAGAWAPRRELARGQHAGVLTAAQILHWLPDRRQRQRGYYEVLWCAMKNNFGATTEQVLALNEPSANLAFVHDSWKRLAGTELCTNCHARLDYGFQFFMGYTDSRASIQFSPDLQQEGTGPLYGRSIDDPRGTGPLTPLGFARLATAQPEFHDCLARHVTDYVLGDDATVKEAQTIRQALDQTPRFRAVMKVALRLYAQRLREGQPRATPPPPAASASAPAAGAPGQVVLPPPVRARLEEQCTECHEGPSFQDDLRAKPFDFRPEALPRTLVVRMVENVARGTMPKGRALDPSQRRELVEMLVDALWSDPAAREEARKAFLEAGRGLPAHLIDLGLANVDRVAGGAAMGQWGAIERSIWAEQASITPGYVAMTALEALRACKAREPEAEARKRCLERATAVENLSRASVGTGRRGPQRGATPPRSRIK